MGGIPYTPITNPAHWIGWLFQVVSQTFVWSSYFGGEITLLRAGVLQVLCLLCAYFVSLALSIPTVRRSR